MAQVFVFGRVTADLTLKTSQSKHPYLCFDLAENTGYGQKQRTLFYQVWAWDTDALRLIQFGVKKRSFLWVTGSLDFVDCTANNGTAKTKRNRFYRLCGANNESRPFSCFRGTGRRSQFPAGVRMLRSMREELYQVFQNDLENLIRFLFFYLSINYERKVH